MTGWLQRAGAITNTKSSAAAAAGWTGLTVSIWLADCRSGGRARRPARRSSKDGPVNRGTPGPITVSFEFFPPKQGVPSSRRRTIAKLESIQRFVSVTYARAAPP
jgi:hypothetical protein